MKEPVLPLPDDVALVLQGGGALGSFQAGAYEALREKAIDVNWIAGISIGAVNAALIAGNPPEKRLSALRDFWNLVTGGLPDITIFPSDMMKQWAHFMSAGAVASTGAPGFFRPHMLPAAFAPPGSNEAISFYDTSPLRKTLDEMVDWDLLNNGPIRVSIGAVDVETGNFAYFDTQAKDGRTEIDARHIMASGALPPGFPPVEIDGRHYWDGGLVSNTPLAYVLEHQERRDMLVFQIDLFPARGTMPRSINDVWSREKDIRYSSRTRQVTDQYLRLRKEHDVIRRLLKKLPAKMRDDKDAQRLQDIVEEGAVSIVQLIYKLQDWESGARDFEFSRSTMRDHWQQGQDAVAATIRKGDILARNIRDGKTASFDLGD
ncbi:patatin-like phospholipase family protein [Sphingorhabdus sp. Alg239-R122]|uniref:patatin-like phospholipase family protein n=1 Tax=Sphingorhabdus sp. Alg239-R122 TaxID=2305989 RepID=UPI0013DB6E9B|nr:patatin-like phospholipase family protein [Sphingorhabdus sp. Alg239-R122]